MSNQELHVKPPLEIEERARKVYSALSNKDSFEIFQLAAEGINASTQSWKEEGFSKKRYYSRLKLLVDLGLVEKDKGRYKHTVLGSIIYENQLKTLSLILDKRSAEFGRGK
jgi:predicted transcriptional regulator